MDCTIIYTSISILYGSKLIYIYNFFKGIIYKKINIVTMWRYETDDETKNKTKQYTPFLYGIMINRDYILTIDVSDVL